MAKKQHKFKFEIFSLLIVIVTFITISAFISYRLELLNKPILRDKLKSQDVNYLYDFYVNSNPNLNNRNFYGDEDAPIDFVAYLNINSEASRYFISEIFPQLDEEFIKTGKIKFYHKNYITMQDLNERNNNFIYAISLLCVDLIKKESYYDFYFDLFDNNIEDISILLGKYELPRQEFIDCSKRINFEQIKEDMSEIENFGIKGINQRFYIGLKQDNTILDGVPSYARFRRAIKEHQIILGD